MTTPDPTPRRPPTRRWHLQIVTTLALAFAATAATAGPALAATHYAATNGTATNWPCTTVSTPCDLATAIQGHGSQLPATGDQVVIEGGAYTFNHTTITAPVAENIHGAAGQTVDITSDGTSPQPAFLYVGGYGQELEE